MKRWRREGRSCHAIAHERRVNLRNDRGVCGERCTAVGKLGYRPEKNETVALIETALTAEWVGRTESSVSPQPRTTMYFSR